jgi:hypothetical protein
MRLHTLFTLVTATMLSATSYADGLDDLTRALERLSGEHPIEARYQVNYVKIEDEGKDQKIKNGDVIIKLKDDESGLSVNYDKEIIKRIDQESQEKIQDEEANTPTLYAIDTFNTQQLKNALNAASQLQRTLSQADFQHEQVIDYQGKSLRKLTFHMPLESIISNKKTRDYVDDFECDFEIIIDEQGYPVQAVTQYKGKGRAYIVLSMKAEGKTTVTYQKYGDRLLRLLSDSNYKYDSTFGKSEFIERYELDVLSEEVALMNSLL